MCGRSFTAIHCGEDHKEPIREPKEQPSNVEASWTGGSNLQRNGSRANNTCEPESWFTPKVRAEETCHDGGDAGAEVHETCHELLDCRLFIL